MGTVHQAKGLEWPVVFVVRFNEEEFPLVSRGDDDTEDLESGEGGGGGGSRKRRRGGGGGGGGSGSGSGSEGRAEWIDKQFQEEERRLAYGEYFTLSLSFIIFNKTKS